MPRVAIIGAGRVGSGWAARFLLHGWDVQVYDPDPAAQKTLERTLANARYSLPGLADMPMPAEGVLHVHDKLADAVAGADWVQESVTECLDLKRDVLAEIAETARRHTTIASSTSGFSPKQLQDGIEGAGRIVVARPVVPVYLLPLVELGMTDATAQDAARRACEILEGIGLRPLHLRRETGGPIADRLRAAVWHEALRIVRDGIASAAEVDDAMRSGVGLLWAQMGVLECQRIAGDDAVARDGGPSLGGQDDVAGETDDRIAQSADQAGEDPERRRDINLVALLRGLKDRRSAAGGHLLAHDNRLNAAKRVPGCMADIADLARPIRTLGRAIPVDWTDYNRHMTEARYLHAFGNATDRFMEIIGCTPEYIATGGSFFTAETHIRHLGETHVAERIDIHTRLLATTGRKMHLWHELTVDGAMRATGEHMLIHVSLETRRASPPSATIAENLRRIAEAQASLPNPEGAGRSVGQPR